MAGNYTDGLAVTYDALDITATKIANEARDLEQDLQELKRLVENSLQYWEGESQSAFDAKLKRWDKEATDIHTALTGIGHVVATAGGTYMEGDKRGASYLQ
ncbi:MULTISPECIES: WXG100 family type VII secretion target [Streptomyces]|uniref:ESAT-6-like protein n=1 Tax=Streptomyces caniscabiei TaxID=2746961 RepID=A0A927QS04_9ACTN|nr:MULTISPECIES: WXG100 family type VII secretion target [Streptomyces]MBD9730034.1 WXG100 family type VII secretion target [Streptomyces caniscabiei]MDX3515769.1 WXG100 family type VII secretion target [Streptomyces caniscabiei]MDX3639010.1 WXG100 family type VII secretion target [Streptomyces sp. MB09-02B]MDX3724988.1 WXG100 family type VII secretion target [Streptomyces caniscabiei]WEO23768.1 WXG100 family type VII secretion target [Streptomyces caniscabiei]